MTTEKKAILGFVIMVFLTYIELTVMGIVTPKIMLLRSILVMVLTIINLTFYYFYVKPVRPVKFSAILIMIILPLVILLTIVNHTYIHHDLKIRQLVFMPSFMFMSIIIAALIYRVLQK